MFTVYKNTHPFEYSNFISQSNNNIKTHSRFMNSKSWINIHSFIDSKENIKKYNVLSHIYISLFLMKQINKYKYILKKTRKIIT